jgi:hypothetical protein
MRKLILELVVFAAIFAVAVPWAILRFDLVRLHEALGKEVWEAVRNAEETVPPNVGLVLGDSVAHQIYGERQETGKYWSLATNQAVTILGHWLLLQRFAEHNDMRGRRVFLVLLPGELASELDRGGPFQYLLKPFDLSADDPTLPPLARERIREIPLWWTARLPIVRLSRWSPVPIPPRDHGPLAPLTVECLRSMRELGRARGFTVKVIAPFMTRKARNGFDDGAFRQAVAREGLEDLFDRYVPVARVLPDDAFSGGADGIHLNPQWLRLWNDDPLAL